jgi:hypothetical protein
LVASRYDAEVSLMDGNFGNFIAIYFLYFLYFLIYPTAIDIGPYFSFLLIGYVIRGALLDILAHGGVAKIIIIIIIINPPGYSTPSDPHRDRNLSARPRLPRVRSAAR